MQGIFADGGKWQLDYPLAQYIGNVCQCDDALCRKCDYCRAYRLQAWNEQYVDKKARRGTDNGCCQQHLVALERDENLHGKHLRNTYGKCGREDYSHRQYSTLEPLAGDDEYDLWREYHSADNHRQDELYNAVKGFCNYLREVLVLTIGEHSAYSRHSDRGKCREYAEHNNVEFEGCCVVSHLRIVGAKTQKHHIEGDIHRGHNAVETERHILLQIAHREECLTVDSDKLAGVDNIYQRVDDNRCYGECEVEFVVTLVVYERKYCNDIEELYDNASDGDISELLQTRKEPLDKEYRRDNLCRTDIE